MCPLSTEARIGCLAWMAPFAKLVSRNRMGSKLTTDSHLQQCEQEINCKLRHTSIVGLQQHQAIVIQQLNSVLGVTNPPKHSALPTTLIPRIRCAPFYRSSGAARDVRSHLMIVAVEWPLAAAWQSFVRLQFRSALHHPFNSFPGAVQ